MFLPRRFTSLLIGIVAGLLVGGALGYNYGRGVPLLSNPFSRKTLGDKVRRVGDRVLENTGRALEKSGRDLQRILDR